MPDENGIVPTIFSVASSMIQNCFGYDPMMSVPLPAEIFGFSPFDCDRGDPAALVGSADRSGRAATKTNAIVARIAGFIERGYGKTRSILRQSFWAAAHFAVQSGA